MTATSTREIPAAQRAAWDQLWKRLLRPIEEPESDRRKVGKVAGDEAA